METLITVPTIFVRLSLFLTFTHSENLIHLAPTALKFKILKDPLEGDLPNLAPPQFQLGTSPT